MSDNKPVCSTITAFAIGAAVGAGIALLLAPQSGKETREMIAKKGQDLADGAKKLVEEGKHVAQDVKSRLTSAVDAGKEAVKDATQKHA
jgi:gas vesicle protein